MFTPTPGILSMPPIVGLLTIGILHGGGIVLTIGMLLVMILGGDGTIITLIILITIMVGTPLMVGTITTTIPNAITTDVRLLLTEVIVPVQNVEYVLPQIATNVLLPTAH
jgi:hypothetical protein